METPEQETSRSGVLASTLAWITPLLAIAWAFDLYRPLGLAPVQGQFVAAMLAFALPAVFLKGGIAVRWWDWSLALLSAGAAGYLVFNANRLGLQIVYRPTDGIVASAILIVCMLEALRRSTGWVLVALVVAFLVYGVWGDAIPGTLQARDVPVDRQILYLVLDSNGLLGVIPGIACTVVVAYILLGNLLLESGGGRFFTDLSSALLGRARGGPAKVAVGASALFGSISGSAVANVVSTGVITIPLMREAGYTREQAGAIEAIASTGGQLMPPIMGAAAFLMADFLAVSYAEVVVAAILPSLLYYVALFIQVDLEAARRNLRAPPGAVQARLGHVLGTGWYVPLPFIIVVVGLFAFNMPPELAAYYAAGLLLCVVAFAGYGGRRSPFAVVAAAVPATGHAVAELIVIAGSASFIVAVINLSGFGFSLTLGLVDLASQSLVLLLLLAAAISIVLGMGMPTIAVYVLLAALVAPALIKAGVVPMAAHMFVIYFGMMSMVTPPVAIAAFAAATLAGGSQMGTAAMAVRLGWTAYIVPFLFVASPSLLLEGSAGETALAAVTALGGVWLVSVAVAGFLWRPLPAAARCLWAVSGIALMVPAGAFPGAIWSDAAGFVSGLVLVAFELRYREPAVG